MVPCYLDAMAQVATNIRLPEELLRELRIRAYRERRSLAGVLREAVERYLHTEVSGRRDPLADYIGSFATECGDIAAQHDHYLYGTPRKDRDGKDPRRHQRPGHARRSRRR